MLGRYANALWAPKKSHYQSICTFAVINFALQKTQNKFVLHSIGKRYSLFQIVTQAIFFARIK